MSPGIYFIGAGGELVEMREQAYDSEAVLQELLEKYPNLLAGDESSDERPRRWVLVRREAGVGLEVGGTDRWWIDHLFLDQDGVPTLVEVKRGADSRIRREVVGQMLDYAANALAYWPLERLQVTFEETCASRGVSPEEALAELGIAESDEEHFWTSVQTNLQAGRMRLVFVADLIPSELERVVEFLNRNMPSIDVAAIEVKQFVGGAQTTLVSRLLGQSAATRQAKSVAREKRQWDETSFFARLSEVCDAVDVDVMREILYWSRERFTRFTWGRGQLDGSVRPILAVDGESHSAFVLGTWAGGVIEFQFHHMAYRARLEPIWDERSVSSQRDRWGRYSVEHASEAPVDSDPSRPRHTAEAAVLRHDRMVHRDGQGKHLNERAPIPNEWLTESDVPGPNDDWARIERFAITSTVMRNGVRSTISRRMANVTQAYFDRVGEMPPLELRALRGCLFFEHRRHHHFGHAPDATSTPYIRALVEDIRRLVVARAFD